MKQGKKLIVSGDGAMALDSQPNVVRFPQCPGKAYNASLEGNFEHTNPQMQKTFLDSLAPTRSIEVSASPSVASSVAQVDGATHVFLANFTGLVGNKNPVQTPQTDVRISLPTAASNSGSNVSTARSGMRPTSERTLSGWRLPSG